MIRSRMTIAAIAWIFTGATSISAEATEIATVQLDRKVVALAQAHLAEATDQYPELSNASISTQGYPIYRPDLDRVAYYEVTYQLPNGGPGGYVMVSTGKHDFPVAQWAVLAKSNSANLNSKLKCNFNSKTDRVYMIDDVTFVAIQEGNRLCGKIGNGIWLNNEGDWKKYREDYSDDIRKRKQSDNRAISSAWKDVDTGIAKQKTPLRKNYCGSWKYRWAGTQSDQMRYRQLKSGEAPNNTKCASGCGATAWAMLFGWIDNQAALGAGKWRNGGMIFGEKATAPSKDMSSEVISAIWEIQGDLQTECFGDQGYTLPNNMAGADKFLRRRGYSPDSVHVRWDPINLGWGRTDEADRTIDGGEPVIVALGAEHYPLAFGYRKKDCRPWQPDKHEFYINDGHGGDFRWTSSKTWFVGRSLLAVDPPTGSGCDTCASRGMKSCPNGCWNPSSCPKCVSLDYDCPPDLCGGCSKNKRCCEPGSGGTGGDSAGECRLCIPRTGGYVCP